MKKLAQIVGSLLFCCTVNQSAFAEGSGSGGDEFRKTVVGYDAKAEKFASKGQGDIAALYKQLAQIKRQAAELGDENRWDEIDWNEYYGLERQVGELISKQNHKK